MRGLYIHIPFCKQICNYCDFPKMVSKKENYKIYLEALKKELEDKKNDLKNIETVYIGGGTPNILSLDELEELFILIKPYLLTSKESTIECNPELVTKDLAKLFSKYKINRVSLGVETINDKLLKVIGRHHTKENVDEAIYFFKEEGINNISCDFIFGLPYQTLDDLKEDLDFVFSNKLNHVSFYSLILEDKTIFSYMIKNNKLSLPEDDLVADMFDYINKRMKENGYIHYEVSNYAKNGYESIHNSLYWQCEEYVGVGLGASSYIKPYRFTNYKTLKNYFSKREEDRVLISFEEEKKEFMMLGLRMLKGVSLDVYKNKFNSDPFNDFDIKKHLDSGLLKIEDNRLFIPEDKIFIANIVYEEFV